MDAIHRDVPLLEPVAVAAGRVPVACRSRAGRRVDDGGISTLSHPITPQDQPKINARASRDIRIFNITGGNSTLVTLNNLTLTGGDVTGSGGAGLGYSHQGGVVATVPPARLIAFRTASDYAGDGGAKSLGTAGDRLLSLAA